MAGFLRATMLLCIAINLFGTSQTIPTTRGDTAIIPCVFGEGTVESIYWNFCSNNGSGQQTCEKILTFFKEELSIEPAYKNRVKLRNDNSTLILKNVTVKDKGAYYSCDVARNGKIAVVNITITLDVFGLSVSSLPIIKKYTADDGSTPAKKFNIITCELHNIYPVTDAKLNWYHGGKYVPSSNDSMPTEDGTFHMIRQINVSRTGNFTCHATFLSANGTARTHKTVEVWITNDTDKPTDNNVVLKVVTPVVCSIGFIIVVIIISIRRSKQKGRKRQVPETETMKKLMNQTNEGSVHLDHGMAANMPGAVPADANAPVPEISLQHLADQFPNGNYTALCLQLGGTTNEAQNRLVKYSNDYKKAVMEVLMEWKNRTGGFHGDLVKALKEIGTGGLESILQ